MSTSKSVARKKKNKKRRKKEDREDQLREMWAALIKAKGKKKKLLSIAANVTAILRLHPSWRGVLVYDAFEEAVRAIRSPPWDTLDAPEDVKPGVWADTDISRLCNWLARHFGLVVSAEVVEHAVAVAAETQRVHPVRKYLRSLKWDGRPRLDAFAPRYLGAEESDYSRAVGPMWMISAVARVEKPGCQADYTLILESQLQGRRKSEAFRALVPVPDWFAETPITIGDKDSYQALHGVWIYCMDELDSVRRGDRTRTKAFLTARRDRYRPPFGRRPRNYDRQNVFCGNTNEEQYLEDPTGNRRYHPLRVTRARVAAIQRDRDQLWAEAFARYKANERWWPDARIEKLCAIEQADRVLPDDWQVSIGKWVRANDGGDGVLTRDVLVGALHLSDSEIKKADTMRCAAVLRSLGYERGERAREGYVTEGARPQVRRYTLADPKVRKEQRAHFAANAKPKKKKNTKEARKRPM
jgi:putative DNA primase/helicase